MRSCLKTVQEKETPGCDLYCSVDPEPREIVVEQGIQLDQAGKMIGIDDFVFKVLKHEP